MENKTETLVKTPEEAVKVIKSNMPTSGYQMLQESLAMAISALNRYIPTEADYEGSLALSLFISCFCLGFCITYILQMIGMI